MATKPKPRRKRSPPVMVVDEDGLSRIALSPSVIRWVIAVVGGTLVAIVTWFTVWDRIEAHWRLETVQSAKDKATEAAIAAAKEKAEADTKALAKRAEIGRSWLFYGLADFRADNSQQWAQVCTALKQSPEVCAKWQADAAQLRQEAAEAKRSATESGKGTP